MLMNYSLIDLNNKIKKYLIWIILICKYISLNEKILHKAF